MKYVRYVGLAHVRQITAMDWRSVGITADPVVWSAQNGFSVPLDHFSEDQITKAIDPDPSFVITGEGGEDGDYTPVPQKQDMTPGQYAQALTNPEDVVAAYAEGRMEAPQSVAEAPGGDAPGVPADLNDATR